MVSRLPRQIVGFDVAIEKLAIKYHPKDDAANRNKEISKGLSHLCMMELSIEYMTGKEAIEVVKKNGEISGKI